MYLKKKNLQQLFMFAQIFRGLNLQNTLTSYRTGTFQIFLLHIDTNIK